MSTVHALVAAMRVRPLQAEADAATIHSWVSRPYARYWDMGQLDATEVRKAYAALEDDPHHHAFVGTYRDEPAFLFEVYNPSHHELAQHFRVLPGDVGMHVLVGPPPATPVHGFTLAVMRVVLDHCFGRPHVSRVVVEPDVRNDRIHRLNAAVGFRPERQVDLSDKRALLSFCAHEDYLRAVAS
jgi:hypothetical protein